MMQAFEKHFFREMKFALSNFLSNENLSISYEYDIFLVKDLTNRVLFSQDQSFGEHTFLARMSLFSFWSLFWPPLISGSTLVLVQSFL